MKLITLGNLETFKNKIDTKCLKSNNKNKIAQSKAEMDTGNYYLGYYDYNINIGGTYIPKGTYSVTQWNEFMAAIFGKVPNSVYGGGWSPIAKTFYSKSTTTITQNNKTIFTFDTKDKTCYLLGIHNSGGNVSISLFNKDASLPSSIGVSSEHIILYASGLFSYGNFPIRLSADLYYKD